MDKTKSLDEWKGETMTLRQRAMVRFKENECFQINDFHTLLDKIIILESKLVKFQTDE